MSNALGRARLLAGKVLGILMTLLPVLAFCFLLGAVLILFLEEHVLLRPRMGPDPCSPSPACCISRSSSSSGSSFLPGPRHR